MANYREIFEKIPDGIVLHDVADGSFLEANQQFCDILGYPRDELLAMDFGAIHVDEPPYTTERAEEYLQRAAEEGPQSFEWRVETKRGGARPVEVHLRRTSIEEESRVLAVVRDIRERKRRQRELRRIRDQMEFVLEATDTIIWTLDLSSEQSTEYGPIDRLFGTEPDGMADFLSEIVHPADRGAVERVYEAVRTGETDVYEVEFRVKDAADGERWFAAKGHVREVPGEDSPRLSGLATEVTDRKRRQEELHRQKDRLEEFTQVVSHDLRNPLNVAEARLELAREESETPHHDDIERAHRRMRNLIEDLLTLAKGVEGTANVEPVELRDVVEESWQSVRTADANLSVDTDRRIEADRSRLKQFLENLVRNAIEHGGTDPEVRVGDLDDGFFVEDDGPGIPEGDRTRIFEAGYSTTSEGTGYGLHIVSDIADEHGWHLSVSENETGGARFEVSGVEIA